MIINIKWWCKNSKVYN